MTSTLIRFFQLNNLHISIYYVKLWICKSGFIKFFEKSQVLRVLLIFYKQYLRLKMKADPNLLFFTDNDYKFIQGELNAKYRQLHQRTVKIKESSVFKKIKKMFYQLLEKEINSKQCEIILNYFRIFSDKIHQFPSLYQLSIKTLLNQLRIGEINCSPLLHSLIQIAKSRKRTQINCLDQYASFQTSEIENKCKQIIEQQIRDFITQEIQQILEKIKHAQQELGRTNNISQLHKFADSYDKLSSDIHKLQNFEIRLK